MKKIVRLTESDLRRIVRRVIMEDENQNVFDENYFNTKKTGKIEFNPSVGYPSVSKVNGLSASDTSSKNTEPFDELWEVQSNPENISSIKGNNQFDYTYDGDFIDLKPSSTNPGLKNWKKESMSIRYYPK